MSQSTTEPCHHLANQCDWMRKLEELLLEGSADDGHLDCHIGQALLQSKDEWIEAARTRWPQHALPILRTAERLSEAITISRDGVLIQVSLIAIPLLFEFDEEIPASLFEQRLFPDGNAQAIAAGIVAPTHFALAPHAYSFEQLACVPISRVRRAIQKLTEGSYSCRPPSTHVAQNYKRRSRYLRYVLGHHFAAVGNRGHVEPLLDAELSGCLIERFVLTSLGLRSTVRVFAGGGYHACLYDGLWQYQQSRVYQLTSDMVVGCRGQVAAQLNIIQSGLTHDLVLDLRSSQHMPNCIKRTYLLRSRPGDSPDQSLALVRQAANAAGLASLQSTIVFTKRQPEVLDTSSTFGPLRIPI